MNVLASYNNQLSAVITAALAKKEAGAAHAEAVKAGTDNLAQALRDYASDTARDGVDAGEASKALRITMLAQVDADEKPLIPSGTIKNYCAALRGYRVMIAREESIVDVNTAKATLVVASDEVKAIAGHKKAFAKITKKWTAAQWKEAVELHTPAAEVPAEDAEQVQVAAAA